MAKSTGKVTIKKYANRRLYDTESSTYITLDRLAAMVREGREFEVVDAKTGEDITRQVLTQIIVDEEARGATMLPINFLKQLIGLYGNSMQNFVPSYLEAAMDAFQRNQSAVKDAFGGNMFADLAKRNMAMFEGAAQAFSSKARAGSQAEQQRRRRAQGRARRAAGQGRPAEPLTIMHVPIVAALALAAQTSPSNPGTPIASNLEYSMPVEGKLGLVGERWRKRSRLFERERRAANDDPLHALEPADRADQDGGRGVPDDVGVDQLAAEEPARDLRSGGGNRHRRARRLRSAARRDRIQPRPHRLQHVRRRRPRRPAVGGSRPGDRGLPRLKRAKLLPARYSSAPRRPPLDRGP